jgi:hypothetical protein
MRDTDTRISPDVALELILRLDINAELVAAGRQLTLTDQEATLDLYHCLEHDCHSYRYYNRPPRNQEPKEVK